MDDETYNDWIAEIDKGNGLSVFITVKPLGEIKHRLTSLQAESEWRRVKMIEWRDKSQQLQAELWDKSNELGIYKLNMGVLTAENESLKNRPVWDNSKAAALLQEQNQALQAEVYEKSAYIKTIGKVADDLSDDKRALQKRVDELEADDKIVIRSHYTIVEPEE